MNKKNLITFLSIALILVGLVGGYYWYTQKKAYASIVQDPFADLKIPEGLDDATKQVYEEKITATKEMYAKLPNIWETWVAIGNLKSLLRDKTGALAAYQHSVTLQPNNIVAERNIAALYDTDLHDYERAVAHYRAAIKNDANNTELYINLITIQWKKLHDQAAAKKTLEDGLKGTRNGYDLVNFAVSFYTEIGDTASAENYKKMLEAMGRPGSPEPAVLTVPNVK